MKNNALTTVLLVRGVRIQRHDIRLGDIVVSSPSTWESGIFQYDFGKTTQGPKF